MSLASVYETSHPLFPSPPSIFPGSLSHEHQSSVPPNESPSDQQLTKSPFSVSQQRKKEMNPELPTSSSPGSSRYENQKRRDWATFGHYLKNHKPPLALNRCSGAHVLEFLRYLDQFGKTKVHHQLCAFYGCPNPPVPCPCPLRQAWGSLDALVGRLRAAFDENGGRPELNPFGARAVRLYLREVKDLQSKARGVSYEKKKRKKPTGNPAGAVTACRRRCTPPPGCCERIMRL